MSQFTRRLLRWIVDGLICLDQAVRWWLGGWGYVWLGRDRPNQASPRATKKAGDFPARKDQPAVVHVTRRIQLHCLKPRPSP